MITEPLLPPLTMSTNAWGALARPFTSVYQGFSRPSAASLRIAARPSDHRSRNWFTARSKCAQLSRKRLSLLLGAQPQKAGGSAGAGGSARKGLRLTVAPRHLQVLADEVHRVDGHLALAWVLLISAAQFVIAS